MILCCGEALIDMLPREVEGGGQGFLPVPGGAIFNTAIALGRLGEDAGFFSSVSTDMFGDQLIDHLNQSNVNTNHCVRLPNPTTLAFVKLMNGQAQYSFIDENSALRNLECAQLPKLNDTFTALHFGAISLIPEPCGTAYEALMANNQEKVLSLDPNIRTDFIQDAATHRDRIDRMIAMADIVKVSDEDLDWIADGKPLNDLINMWLDGATSVVLLTKGSNGVTAYTRTGWIKHPAINTVVIDTIGAGDTFNAGFLAGLQQSRLLTKYHLNNVSAEELKPALQLAAKVAAYTVSNVGANPPWRSEL